MKKIYGWIIGLILLSFVMAGVFLTIAPEVVPVHYGVGGNVDRWGSKYELLLLPAISLLGGAVMLLTGKFGTKGEPQNERVVGVITIWMLILFNGLWAFFMVKALQGGTVHVNLSEQSMKWVAMALLGSFIPLGNLMPKVKRNSMLGLRTKWSMANDVCWQKSQRLAGFCMVSTGIVGIAVTAIAPADWSVWILLGLIGVSVIVLSIGSYLIYKRETA